MYSFIKKFLTLTSPHRNWMLLYLASALIVAVCDVTVGYLIKSASDLTSVQLTDVINLIYLFVLVAIVGTLFKFTIRYAGGRFASNVIMDYRNRIAGHISNLSISTQSKLNTGDLVSRTTNDINQLHQFIQSTFLQMSYQPIVFMLTCSFLGWLNWKLVLFTVMVVPITVTLAHRLSKPIKAYRSRESELDSEILAIAQDSVLGIYTEKAFNLHDFMNRKFAAAVKKSVAFQVKRERRQAILTPFEMTIRIIPMLCCSIYGAYLSIHGELTPGGLFAFVFLVQYLIDPLAVIPEILGQVRAAQASLDRLSDVLKIPAERRGGQSVDLNRARNIIEFRQVYFQYDNDHPVLRNLSFEVLPNQKIAIVGSSGSGKSTIFQLICGHYPANEGTVNLFGEDLRNLDLEQVRSEISVVSQDTYLFPGTIQENISYGKPGALFEEIVNAAKAAHIHDFIKSLPDGYHTVVGERGHRLSGGQKQRISIARSLLKQASILLFDEATSALDTESEKVIEQNMKALMQGRTVLIIAHRLSTILNADEILVIHQGAIVERGTHAELLRNGSRYQELYRQQFMNETEFNQEGEGCYAG